MDAVATNTQKRREGASNTVNASGAKKIIIYRSPYDQVYPVPKYLDSKMFVVIDYADVILTF